MPMKLTKYSPLAAYDSLKWFVSSRPPLIISVILLGLLALILMTLAFYVQHSQLNKPDISQDWNLFMESFEKLDFCIDNGTMGANAFTANPHIDSISMHDVSTTPASVTPVELGTASDVHTTSQAVFTSTSSRNFSVQMMLEVKPTFDFISIPHNLTYLSGSILGSELGLKGSAGEEWISLAAQLPFEWNTTRCESFFSKACDTVHIYTCVHLQASELVFPTSRSPQRCEVLNDTGVEYHALMKTYKQKLFSANTCYGRTIIHARYKLDSRLTVMLSLSDRSVINLHLLHSSYFVFVMTITILLYVVIRGLPVRLKSAHQLWPGSSVDGLV